MRPRDLARQKRKAVVDSEESPSLLEKRKMIRHSKTFSGMPITGTRKTTFIRDDYFEQLRDVTRAGIASNGDPSRLVREM
jgi:hypothetical protein